MIHWLLLYDPRTARNVAAVLYDPESESIRCESAHKELAQALEESQTRGLEIKIERLHGIALLNSRTITDPEMLMDEAVRPFLNPLRIGSRGILRDSGIDLARQIMRPYVIGTSFSEPDKPSSESLD